MKEIINLLEKIDKNTLTSSEVFSFSDVLKKKYQKGNKGFEKVSKDEYQWLQTYGFTLRKSELAKEGKAFDIRLGGDWRQSLDDVSKLKFLVDELEAQKLVDGVAWEIDGIVLFNITKPERYKNKIFEKIRTQLEKIMD
ncbi:MAG: hypothetical protein E4G94_11065 [ANME-2 cluster archaeon]|nr:MAG: hypothetical protein E4G94_11065 [ANME-2 cluster archaeon]